MEGPLCSVAKSIEKGSKRKCSAQPRGHPKEMCTPCCVCGGGPSEVGLSERARRGRINMMTRRRLLPQANASHTRPTQAHPLRSIGPPTIRSIDKAHDASVPEGRPCHPIDSITPPSPSGANPPWAAADTPAGCILPSSCSAFTSHTNRTPPHPHRVTGFPLPAAAFIPGDAGASEVGFLRKGEPCAASRAADTAASKQHLGT